MPTSGPWPPYSAAGQRLRRNLQKESSVNVLDLPDLARRPRAFPGVPPAQYRAAQGPYNQQHARACIGLHGLTVTHLVCRLLLEKKKNNTKCVQRVRWSRTRELVRQPTL